MEKNFLTVGNYTSSSDSRGFFSRGAKDVSNIGNVIFESIKDNKYSKIEINTEGMGRTVSKNTSYLSNLQKRMLLNNLNLVLYILMKMHLNLTFAL